MALTPHEIRDRTFPDARRGYEKGDVHRFLDQIARQIEAAAAPATGGLTFQSKPSKEKATPPPPPAVDPPLVEPAAAEISLDKPSEAPVVPVVEAPVVPVEPMPVDSASTAPVEPVLVASTSSEATTASTAPAFDEFDHVGSEISFMLRQANESAAKIRRDAELEAEAMLAQVTSDIESDRAAHDEAAATLIARTEKQADELRLASDEYAAETRRTADEHADNQRIEAERSRIEADETMATAQAQAEEIVNTARAQARSISDDMVNQAREKLSVLTGTEEHSRSSLEQLSQTIAEALDQMRIAEIEPELNA